jgi:hypothetical protein
VEVVLERGHSGSGCMGVELGREELVAAFTSGNTAPMYKGSVLNSDCARRIAEINKMLARLEKVDRSVLREERRRRRD